MAMKTFPQDTVIFREGETGDTFYQVLAGQVQVFIDYGTEQEKRLSNLGPGAFFGEIAALGAYPRTATIVTAGSGATLLEITTDSMMDVFEENPMTILSLMQQLGRRIVSLSADCSAAHKALDEQQSVLRQPAAPGLLDRARMWVDYFFGSGKGDDKPTLEEKLSKENGGQLSDGYSAQVFSCDAKTVIFREGDPAACMYAIHYGRVGIYSGYGTDNERLLTELCPNSFFGELGMLCAQPRSATAVALDDETTLEIIRPEDLADLFRKNPIKIQMILDYLTGRLRSLTSEYAAVCKDLCEQQ